MSPSPTRTTCAGELLRYVFVCVRNGGGQNGGALADLGVGDCVSQAPRQTFTLVSDCLCRMPPVLPRARQNVTWITSSRPSLPSSRVTLTRCAGEGGVRGVYNFHQAVLPWRQGVQGEEGRRVLSSPSPPFQSSSPHPVPCMLSPPSLPSLLHPDPQCCAPPPPTHTHIPDPSPPPCRSSTPCVPWTRTR